MTHYVLRFILADCNCIKRFFLDFMTSVLGINELDLNKPGATNRGGLFKDPSFGRPLLSRYFSFYI